eukprot:2695837-Karenia_brevis.AAC.1
MPGTPRNSDDFSQPCSPPPAPSRAADVRVANGESMPAVPKAATAAPCLPAPKTGTAPLPPASPIP